MFWIGFGAGTSLSVLIILIGLIILFRSIGNSNKRDRSKVEVFWEMSVGHQEEQIRVLKDLANQVRG